MGQPDSSFRLHINGKRWNFVRKSITQRTSQDHLVLGLCDPPDKPNKCITVHKGLTGEEELDTIIHETLHAASWDVLGEEFVGVTATSLARLLYRIGYRKQKDPPNE